MAWIYLAESEESPWGWNPGLKQSPIVRMIDMPKQSFCPECKKEDCPSHQYGMMWELSPISTCPSWTSSQEDSHARISALQELEGVWMAADQVYFSKSFASLANFDRGSFSWKTCQLSLFGGLTAFSWSSLRWGTIVDGRLYQPQKWEPAIFENDGSYLPTPTLQDTHHRVNFIPQGHNGRRTANGARHGISLATYLGGKPNPIFLEWLMGYRTNHTELKEWAIQWFQYKPGKPLRD